MPTLPPPRLPGGWRAAVHRRLAGVPGLVRVLMKPRNGQAWTPEDRVLLRRELRVLLRAVPAVALVAFLPGGLFLLPVYAWALDRRRRRRPPVPPEA